MDDAIAVSLEIVAVGMRGFGKAASAGLSDLHRVRRQHGDRIAVASSQCPVPSTQRSLVKIDSI